jgi:hypothetical protein
LVLLANSNVARAQMKPAADEQRSPRFTDTDTVFHDWTIKVVGLAASIAHTGFN